MKICVFKKIVVFNGYVEFVYIMVYVYQCFIEQLFCDNLFLCFQVVYLRFQDLVFVYLKDEGDLDLDRLFEEDIEEVK